MATATSINKVAITAPATSATITIADGKTLTVNNSLLLAGTDSATSTLPPVSATIPGITGKQGASSLTTGDGTAQTVYTYTLPGNTLSSTGALRFKGQFTVHKTTSSTSVYDIIVTFGGSTIYAGSSLSFPTSNNRTFDIDIYIANEGATNTNSGTAEFKTQTGTGFDSSTSASQSTTRGTANALGKDTTSDQVLLISYTETVGAPACSFRLSHGYVEIIK